MTNLPDAFNFATRLPSMWAGVEIARQRWWNPPPALDKTVSD